tara:strand:- start:5776 stop:6291 length:516 start_codon:yes stop_codon:yes gene_type:complete
MKKSLLLSITSFLLLISFDARAQLRGDVSQPIDYRGSIINSQSATVQSKLASFFQNNVQMSHSYAMSFSSVGGSYQNLNAYTNTMDIAFSDRLQGRVDVSFFHSPFGGNNLYGYNQNKPQVMLSNAELNYKISDNATIRLQYQRLPYNSFGLSPFGYNRYNNFNSFNPGFY